MKTQLLLDYESLPITNNPTPKNLLTYQRLPQRIKQKIEFIGDCWVWKLGKDSNGYGRLSFKGEGCKAHRVVYELLTGPIPEGLTLDHLCRNRPCVNPAHLEPVTLKENLLRGVGVGVINAAKTHCKNGHEFTYKNTYQPRDNVRMCRTCMVENTRKWMLKKRESQSKQPLLPVIVPTDPYVPVAPSFDAGADPNLAHLLSEHAKAFEAVSQ